MRKTYKKEVLKGLNRTKAYQPRLITPDDMKHLPPIVKKYLEYTGVTGKNMIYNARIKFEGRIRSKPDSWMSFTSEQYNFFDNPSRFFYIKAWKMGIPAFGIHIYKDEKAIMKIKLAGLFTIVDGKGFEMNQGETVTVLNDMCCMAPGTLIDKNISWEIIDPLTVKARYTNGKITVGATLFFNETGQLINFISNDRFESADGKIYHNYPWSTPLKEYRDFNGIRAASSASTIYHRPENDFCYGEFILKEIEYNCTEFKS